MERVRLRLTFEDPHILSDLQKSEGLRRSWFLLKPQLLHSTISDLSSHILGTFQLHNSCPHGLLLSMDGFLLPPFESTCILKDKCIVSVKKKGGVLAIEGNDAPNVAENMRIVEKQLLNTGHLPLVNKEFDNESGGYESEDESEDEEGADPTKLTSSHQDNSFGCIVISEKRKALETLPSSKNKKHCSEVAEKVDEQTMISQQGLTSKKSLCKQKNVADPDSKDLDSIKGSAESSKVNDGISDMKKNNDFQEKGVENVEATTKPERVKKGPSRSARRQYAKRQWLREMVKIYKNVASEAEGLELQANGGRRAGNLHPKWLVNGETDGRPKGRRNWKQQQSKTECQEMIGQPKGLLHWKQSREENKGRNTNRQEQANEKSTLCEKPGQHSNMEDDIIPDQALQKDQAQEIDFPSVIEVGLVENGNSDSVAEFSGQPSEGPATNKSNPALNASEKRTNGPENGVNLWEQHSEALEAEKEQLHKESSWGTWSSGKKSSWSGRPLEAEKEQLHKGSSWGMWSSGKKSSWSERPLEVEKEQLHKGSSWGMWSSGKKSSWSERPLRGNARGPTMPFRRYRR